MTRSELATLDQFVDEFREFRTDDRTWKVGMDDRLRRVETFVTSVTAIGERDEARGVSHRALVAATISAIGVGASLVLGLYNIVS